MATARKPAWGRGKLDVEAVRAAASGRWRGVLQHVAGLPAETLDGRHHPCPKCGGEDRFRLIDEAAGAVLCNQCFAEKNGDGFSAVAWTLGVKFPEAVKRVADYCGVAPAKGEADPAKDLRWIEWSSALAAWYLRAKGPTTEAVLIADGCRMARYKDRFTVIAWPIIGETLDVTAPVGWVICKHDGGPLPKWDKKGEIVGQTKYKITYGSKPGFVGRHAVERIKTPGLVELVWKCEGISDLGAVRAAIPPQLIDRHVALTNSSGAGETLRWMAGVLARQNCNLLHDADEPGQAGATKSAADIAAQAAPGIIVRNVALPYTIEAKHGKDSRDYLGEGRTYGELLTLADQSTPVTIARTEAGEVDLSKAHYPENERILKKLQLEVLYEDDDGKIRVFSTLLRKSSWIKKMSQLKLDDLYQVCGPPAVEHIVISEADTGDDQWSMREVRRAIGMTAASRRGKHDERGVGVWQGLDDQGNETDTIVLVSNNEGARWNGDKVLRRILVPRADGLVLDLGSALAPWYEFETVERNLAAAADVDWRCGVIEEATALFGRWRWKNPAIDPDLVAGLVLATFVQTIFAWRPLVAVSGESNSGKSYLFEALGGSASNRGIFGLLAFKQAKSTAAGVLQGIGRSARIALCDEFEAGPERDKTLEAFRQSCRGDARATGTANQKSNETRLQHIPWVAAIETGLHRQPDSNRFVQLELLTAEHGRHGRLRLPSGRELSDLGQRLLAISVRCGIEAKKLAVALKDTTVAGVDPRTVESYAVPAAMLAVAADQAGDVARALLVKLLGNVDRSEQGRRDQDELLSDILTASVHLDGKTGVKAVNQVLESPSLRMDYGSRVEAAGVRLLDDYSLFVIPKLVLQNLLRGTTWERQRIDQILLRLQGAERRQLKIVGRSMRGVWIPAVVAGVTDKPDANGQTTF